jgi:hypothetical protein
MRANQKKYTPGECNGHHEWRPVRAKVQPSPFPVDLETGVRLDVELKAEDCINCDARHFVPK